MGPPIFLIIQYVNYFDNISFFLLNYLNLKTIVILITNVVYSFMPIVTVSLFGGRTQREKDRLAEAITESVCKILRVDKKEVIVVFLEGPHGNFYSEGVRL
jgi:4-oxalocrotonate tautomerase